MSKRYYDDGTEANSPCEMLAQRTWSRASMPHTAACICEGSEVLLEKGRRQYEREVKNLKDLKEAMGYLARIVKSKAP
jgi:hypothetical protein